LSIYGGQFIIKWRVGVVAKRNDRMNSPGDYIREELTRRGWGQGDLALIMGRPVQRINELVLGKTTVSPELAVELAAALGGTAEDWLSREASYRLHRTTNPDADAVRRRARVYELAPIRDLQKRGWIATTDDPEELEREILKFFEISSINEEPAIIAVFRKSTRGSDLTPCQKAWCFRVKHLAKALRIRPFDVRRAGECEKELRRLAAFPQEGRKVPAVLASFGVRFVIVEPLPGCKIDGAALWLDESSPAIALSMRFDRVDAFWFNLGHEWSHIKNRDPISIDSDLVGHDRMPAAAKPPMERRADADAAAMFVPPKELESFVLRIAPMFSKERIVQFANKIKIHPGIIVGQLQHRGDIGFHANREMLVKIRHLVVPSAVTDGWGESIDPKVFA
jgi:HTH-type transcriptional regulator / antitoxin HigA